MHADLQRLLADDLLADFASKPMERLRSLRVQLNEAEADVSFVRRVTQGRLDIVGHEVERRAVGRPRPADARPSDPSDSPGTDGTDGSAASEAGVAEADDPSSLLFAMPDILTDDDTGTGVQPRSAGAVGRAVSVLDPGRIALAMVDTLDGIASPSQLSGIQRVNRADLADLFDTLREFELELSSIRRRLHDRIDTIQDEIARRYRDGEASVDSLLR